jgi:maltose alpha-D-glucosyltransferase/alpha-amylase
MALATDSAGPAFTPEPVPAMELKHRSSEIVASAEVALDILKARRDVLKEINRPLLDLLLAQRTALPNILQSLLPDDGEVTGIRHHGNLHLEQVLIVKDDVFITDFNGEPRRTQAERRRKAPAVRDVAGMIHSIDCAAAAALERARKVTPDEQGKLAAALAKWRERSVETFLAAYRETIADVRLWPADPWAAQRLIDFFLLEKGFHELEYEAAHEVERLRFPLASILRILSRQPNVNE